MHATRNIDFATLSLCDALDLAVLIEEEARDRYNELADQLMLHGTAEAAIFFRKMSVIEERHRSQLAERRVETFGTAPVRVTRAMLFDIEAPDYDEARAFMTVRDALDTALKSEKKAHAFFEAALANLIDHGARELFTELRDEEVEHQELVLAEIAKLPARRETSAKDYSDDPVSQ